MSSICFLLSAQSFFLCLSRGFSLGLDMERHASLPKEKQEGSKERKEEEEAAKRDPHPVQEGEQQAIPSSPSSQSAQSSYHIKQWVCLSDSQWGEWRICPN
jgi:hypothetical protein